MTIIQGESAGPRRHPSVPSHHPKQAVILDSRDRRAGWREHFPDGGESNAVLNQGQSPHENLLALSRITGVRYHAWLLVITSGLTERYRNGGLRDVLFLNLEQLSLQSLPLVA